MGKVVNEVVAILMRRDGITEQEANTRVKVAHDRIMDEAIEYGDYGMAEDIMADELGLEMDYLHWVI